MFLSTNNELINRRKNLFKLLCAIIIVFTLIMQCFVLNVYAAGNADLKGFTVNGGYSYPAFEKDKILYGVRVSKDVTEIEIIGIPEDPNAKVESPGKVTNLPLESTIKKKIIVTSADGSTTKTYSFYITRYDRIITPEPAEETAQSNETPQKTPEKTPDKTQEEKSSEASKSAAPDSSDKATALSTATPKIAVTDEQDPDDKETVARSFNNTDMAICVILSFMAGILVGYAIFYFSDKRKNIKSKL